MNELINEYISCLLCKSGEYDIIYKKNFDANITFSPSKHKNVHGQIVKCKKCGLIYTNPRIDQSSLVKFYQSYDDDDDSSESLARSYTSKKIVNKILKYKNAGRVIEIGCATGILLNELKKAGFEVTGLELSIWACESGKKEYNLNIQNCDLNNAKFSDKIFDAVILNDTIEHISDPTEK